MQIWWAEVGEGWCVIGRDLSDLWRQSWSSRVGPVKSRLEPGCTTRAEGFRLSSLDDRLWA